MSLEPQCVLDAGFEGAYKWNGRDWRIPQTGVDAFLAQQRGERLVAQLRAWRAVRRANLLRG